MMEKRLFYAIFITFLFLIGYTYLTSRYFTKNQPQENKSQTFSPSPPKEETNTQEEIVEEDTANLKKVSIGKFTVTYSIKGGYIKTLFSNIYGEELLFKNIGYIPQEKEKQFIPRLGKGKITFTTPEGERKEFIFKGDILEIVSSSPSQMIIFSNSLAANGLDQRYQEFFYFQQGMSKRKSFKKIGGEIKDIEFAGARDRYYCLSLLPGSYDIKWVKTAKKVHLYLTSPMKKVTLYVGPQIEEKLKPLGLQGIIYYGFFHGIGVVIIKLLYFFHFLTKNWGVSIILLTILVYFVLSPFTAKSTKAMRRMQELQPEIEELKKKHKDNPQKLNKETIGLYRKYKINPLGGCLPLFFQFPIFIALYQILFRFVELKKATFLWINDLSLPDRLFFFPAFDKIPILKGYINLLPILMIILGLLQHKITAVPTAPSEQKSMGLFFAVFIGVIFYNFPSCLALYWFTQSLLTFIYQLRISKQKIPLK